MKINKKLYLGIGIATALLLSACGNDETQTKKGNDKVVVQKKSDEINNNKTEEKKQNNTKEESTQTNLPKEKESTNTNTKENSTTTTNVTTAAKMTERTARNVLIGFVDKDMNSMDVMNFKLSDETPEYFNFIYTDGNGKQLGDNLYSVKKDYSSVMVSNGVEGKLLEQIKLPENVKKFASRTWVKDETDVTYDVTLYFNSNNSGYISYNEGTQARLHQIFTKFTLNGNEGRFSFTQRDDSEQGSGSGKFVLKGDTLEFTFDGFKPIQLR